MNRHTCYWLSILSIGLVLNGNVSTSSPVLATPVENTIFEVPELGGKCNEPAPTNFHTVEVSPLTIKAVWDVPASTPFEYNVSVRLFDTGVQVQEFNIPGSSLEVNIDNLTPNTTYEIVIRAVCEDGTMSIDFSTDIVSTSVLDLVVSGYSSPPVISVGCNIDMPSEFCYLNPPEGHVVVFRIQKKGNLAEYRDFGVSRPLGCDNYLIKLPNGNPNYSFSCDGTYLYVKYNNELVAKLIVYQPTNNGNSRRLVATDLVSGTSGYEIERRVIETGYPDQIPGGACPGESRSLPTEKHPKFSAQPNPFTDQLEIQLPFNNPTENTRISLYDLQGRLVMTAQSPGDQQTIQLSTLNLAPGMYFLRAESGGVSETVKVVRAQ